MRGSGLPELTARTAGGNALTYPAQTCLINQVHYTTERLRVGLSRHCILHYLEAEAGSIIRSMRFIKAFERAVSVSSICSEVRPQAEILKAPQLQLVTLEAPIMLNFDSVR